MHPEGITHDNPTDTRAPGLLALLGASAAALAAKPEKASPEKIAFDPPLGSAKLLLSEDFESTPAGEIPKGFTKTGAVGVVDDVAHSGKKSLRMEAAANGARRITAKGDVITALGGEHWGRLYFKVQLPAPEPQGTGKFPVIHSTLVAGSAQSPLAKDPIEVPAVLDTVLGPKGTFQYIYNVQPQKRPEFGKGSDYNYRYTDEWTLAEWYVDYATQTYRLFINGDGSQGRLLQQRGRQVREGGDPRSLREPVLRLEQLPAGRQGLRRLDRRHRPEQGRIGDRGLPPRRRSTNDGPASGAYGMEPRA